MARHAKVDVRIWDDEHATCATRSEADRLAREQAVESMQRGGAQRELFETGET